MKIGRYISDPMTNLALKRGKMAFLSGPRQVGKTTLASECKPQFDQFNYKNWDDFNTQKLWAKNPQLLLEEFNFSQASKTRLLVLDEIHKSKNWKSRLKGLYDTNKDWLTFLITGSARLNVYKKGSDSLLGRYLHFRLHPFSYGELTGQISPTPDEFIHKIFIPPKKIQRFKTLDQLFEFSGFPEPYLTADKKVHNLWRKGRRDLLIKEDLRDLSIIHEISQVEVLCSLLPDKVGSPLSVQSLTEDVGVTHQTVTRWLGHLRELYYFFEVSPYSKTISRSIKKEKKIYFYDWTECPDLGARFENMVACHLLKACHYWEDTGEGDFQLHYLRDKERNEIDFLITRDKKPLITIECKLKSQSIEKGTRKLQSQLNCPHIQVVFADGAYQKLDSSTWIMSAEYLLRHLP